MTTHAHSDMDLVDDFVETACLDVCRAIFFCVCVGGREGGREVCVCACVWMGGFFCLLVCVFK